MTLGVPKISDPLSLAVVWMYSLAGLEINSYSSLTGELVSPRQILCKGKRNVLLLELPQRKKEQLRYYEITLHRLQEE